MRRIFLLAIVSLFCGHAAAQDYPSKPVQIIVPFPPGGGTDLLARVIADKLRERFGQPVTVENRSGAAGNIGAEAVYKAPADGHTLLFTQPAPIVVNKALYAKLGFEPERFVPIALVSIQDIMLAANPKLPANDLKELIAYAKANPGRLNFGSSGAGSAPHLAAELFASMAGVKMVHVPYKGGILSTLDLVAGQIQLSFADMVPSVPQVKANKLRALAVTSEQRSNALPDVPTMKDAGVKAEFPTQWWAFAAPRGTPAAVIGRLNADIGQAMKAPDLQEKYASMGIFTAHTTSDRVSELQKSGTKLMAGIVKRAGIQPE